MPSIATALFGLAVAAVAVNAAPIAPAGAIAERGQPKDWATGYLEPYGTYHLRYLALDCQDQHNTTFFDDCCHPLLATQSLADRQAYCTPNATQISQAAVLETATSSGVPAASSAAADAESEYCDATSTASAAAAATTTSTPAAVADFATHTTTTSTYVAPTTKTTQAAATTTAASSGGNANTGGFATFFYQGGNAGECGTVHSDSEYGIAIDAAGWWGDYQSNSNSQYCGKQIVITNTNNGKSVTATVWDVCPTCVNNNSLDLSVAAFNAIASESDGMVPISWHFA